MAKATPAFNFSNFSGVKSDSGRWVNGRKVYYNHRLPTKEYPLTEDGRYYLPFDSFNHVTSYDTAKKVLKENNLIHHQVRDNSLVNLVEIHPLRSKKVLWFGPGCRSDNSPVERYGNVKFGMKGIKNPGGMIYESVNYYFVEVIDYFTQSACRILVTPNTYPELRVYDPYQRGGPWYIDENRNHFHLTKILKDGEYRKNTLEIMREEHNSQFLIENLNVCYVECYNPRIVLDVETALYDSEDLQPHLWRLVDGSEFTWKEY